MQNYILTRRFNILLLEMNGVIRINCTHSRLEEKIGVVSPHIPYIEETYNEPYDYLQWYR